MGIELKITADSTVDLHAQIAALLAGAAPNFVVPSGQVVESEATEINDPPAKPARTPRRPKAEPTSETPPQDAEGNGSTSTPESGDTSSIGSSSTESGSGESRQPDEPQVQYGDVQKAVTGLAAAKGRDAVMKVYDNFGVDHATKLKPEQWVDVIAELDAAREAA